MAGEVRSRLRALWARVAPRARRALTVWRRSIQARVVVSTVLLSALVVAGVSFLLLQQTRNGLLEHRVEVVLGEVDAEMRDARARLAAASGTESNASRQQRDLVDPIIERGRGRGYSVALAGPAGEGRSLRDGGGEYTSGLDLLSIPRSLESHFDGVNRTTAWTYTEIASTAEAQTRAGVVVGSQIQLPSDGRTYTLYFLYPFTEEEETLGLVTRALLTAAGLLMALVAGVTWLVTRQVVTPVRLARQVAERLAAGRLQERLEVTGEDDIARLAYSFNQMATNLQRQIRQLEELSWVQRRFVSDVSHELRTPLTTVRMASDLIHDARADFHPSAARAAELLQAELDRFEALLVDLLEISRFDAGAAVLTVEEVDLAEVAERVVAAARPLAEQRGVQVWVEPPQGPVTAEADVRRVERIVRNLVTNAIDHADVEHPARAVVVRLAADEDAAALTVRDNGVGLAPGEAAMVFNRFWRSDPARARTSGGTGLGLAIAQEDAHLHGGWLQAWGRTGEGALFRLTLPRHPGTALRHSPLPLIPDTAPIPTGAAPTRDTPVREPDRGPRPVASSAGEEDR
ncbi:HAMP domain-containing histidine kinase [Nocardioides sp. zg-536]|uniref:Sensor histidine kinase MtrB n=1 Tax=Nocardioides faecalis TaxID=2803858 RepID=A0A939BV89_9ACTN|nr:MtrAB system histidine kinase MtrB [Nocardioides faecalis]MBM9459312.1 HAMP domain-containing histidine kinase [Nocardioides faecalis]MBS4751551.1 HAMP domain-containing histidine kinase [Nocardioides faecalis]QVI59566.1 HAMP domain-containing histidine kinase [Nocardioides faecalis]